MPYSNVANRSTLTQHPPVGPTWPLRYGTCLSFSRFRRVAGWCWTCLDVPSDQVLRGPAWLGVPERLLARLHDRAREGLPSPSRPGPKPTAPASSPWPSGTPTARPSALSWTPTPPTPPCSPSPLTSTNAKFTSARSSDTAKACAKAHTADATARPSPPARYGSPPAPSRRTRLPDRRRAQRSTQGGGAHQSALFSWTCGRQGD